MTQVQKNEERILNYLKASAFPAVAGIMIWFGKDMVSEVRETKDKVDQIIINQARQEGVIQGKFSNLESEIQNIKERVDKIEQK